MKISDRKEMKEISQEWDEICYQRQEIIDAGKDISLTHVIIPAIIDELKELKCRRLLDVGCGTGFLTEIMKDYSEECTGIDASGESISYAKNKYQKEGLAFFRSTMKEYVCEHPYDVCVSNMALMSDPEYFETLKRIRKTLTKDGVFLIMMTHPCFWPRYWGIDEQKWFCYKEEIFIEHDFSISLVKSIGKATYIHRSLEQYLSTIKQAGFLIEKIKEVYPKNPVPEGYKYDYPRFLLLRCRLM